MLFVQFASHVLTSTSSQYAMHIFSPDGRLLHSYTPTSPNTGSGLGIRTVAWHTSGRFLAIGGYDDNVKILNDISWSVVGEVDMPGSAFVSAIGGKRRRSGRLVRVMTTLVHMVKGLC